MKEVYERGADMEIVQTCTISLPLNEALYSSKILHVPRFIFLICLDDYILPLQIVLNPL